MTQMLHQPVQDIESKDFLTFTIADHQFGIPVDCLQDIFMPESLTPVPLADETIGGVLNLRGCIVTMINTQKALGLDTQVESSAQMAIRIVHNDESFGLLVDMVGDVLSLTDDLFEDNPRHLDPQWQSLTHGIYRLNDALMVVLDVHELLNLKPAQGAV